DLVTGVQTCALPISFDGRIGIGEAPELSLSWGELAAAAADPSSLPPGMRTGLRAQADFEMEDSTYPSGAHVAVVEVDTETGKVRSEEHTSELQSPDQ